MGVMIKMLSVLFVVNMFMYLGVNFAISSEGDQLNEDYNFHFNGDLLDYFLSGNENINEIAQNTKENYTSYGVGLNSTFTQAPEKESGFISGTGVVAYLDPLSIVWSFIATLGNLMIAPLTLFFNFNMPVFVGLMIGIPYFLVLVLTMFAFIRGAGD